MDVDIVIEGVADPLKAEAISQKIRGVCRRRDRPGEWSVLVSPAEIRGQWDFGLRGPSERYFASFTDDSNRLPDLIEEKLRAFLQRAPAPLGK
jgi:hypothetical protein